MLLYESVLGAIECLISNCEISTDRTFPLISDWSYMVTWDRFDEYVSIDK